MASLTKLDAVNALLRAITEYPVAALDTGGTSMAAQAERVLDFHDKLIQGRGWHENREYDVEIDAADATKMAMVIAAGAWNASALTLTKVAAFATYTFEPGDQISVTGGTGVTVAWYEIASRTDDDVIILKESIAAANNADTTTDLIGWEDAVTLPADCLKADSYGSTSWRDVVLRNGMLFDRNENTFSFTDVPKLAIARQLAFASLTLGLQNLIIAEAGKIFQRRTVGGRTQDAFLREEEISAKQGASRDDQEAADFNILNTPFGRQIGGHRSGRRLTR